MSDKITLRKTLYLFNQESNMLFRSNWNDSPTPFRRFIERIESQPVIKVYLDECVASHTPDGFDAASEVDTVANDYGAVFGPFSTDPEEESAQVYLILKELIEQDVRGNSLVFYGYASKKFADMYKAFLDRVARRLIANIECHLNMIGIEMGLDSADGVTNNFNGPVQTAQLNQPTGGSTVNATQTIGFNTGELNTLLDAILTAANIEIEDGDTISDIRDNVEIVRVQMESGEPKRGIIKGAFGFLRGVNGGVQFAAALAQIAEFMANSGIKLPFPS